MLMGNTIEAELNSGDLKKNLCLTVVCFAAHYHKKYESWRVRLEKNPMDCSWPENRGQIS